MIRESGVLVLILSKIENKGNFQAKIPARLILWNDLHFEFDRYNISKCCNRDSRQGGAPLSRRDIPTGMCVQINGGVRMKKRALSIVLTLPLYLLEKVHAEALWIECHPNL